MKDLFEQIKHNHHFTPPLPQARIAELEAQLGFNLPADLKEFYGLCNGAMLFPDRGGWRYRFVPLEEMRRVRIDVLGVDEDFGDVPTASWYSLCDVQDGNFVAIDLASTNGSFSWIIDCFHEEFGLGPIIALSFTEFVERALKSNGDYFWLKPGRRSYGHTWKPE